MLVSTHIFFAAAGRAPYVAVDDLLMNVSVTLAKHGRYAFFASPMQGSGTIPRSDVFYNYGPWYFVAGAALQWLFGPSLELMRYLHPLGLMVIAAMAVWAFRRRSLAAGAIVASGLLVTFWRFQWPMVRPDIAVSVCAAAGLAAATVAIRTGRWAGWCVAGAAVAAAVIQHEIAWALAPALVGLWGLDWAARREAPEGRPGPTLVRFAALAGGAAAVIAVFLAFIRFHVEALVSLLFAYSGFVHEINPEPYSVVLSRHFAIFWNAIPAPMHVLFPLALAVCAAAMLDALVRPSPARREALAAAAPPVAFFAAYLLSLGLYPNFHAGYAILDQVCAIWTLGAAWYVAQDLALRHAGAAIGRGLDVAATTAMAGLLVWQSWGLHARPPWIVAAAAGNVPFEALMDRVLGPLPAHASVWGPVVLGLESGTRVDLVQFGEGPAFLETFRGAGNAALAPEFVIFGNQERAGIRIPRPAGTGAGTRFQSFDPPAQYRLMALTDAPPYGTFETYVRSDLAVDADAPPIVAVNDGATPEWRRRLGAPLPVRFVPTDPISILLGPPGAANPRPPERSDRAVQSQGDVPAGTYVIALRLTGVGHGQVGSIVGMAAPRVRVGFSDMGLLLLNDSGGMTAAHLAQADYLPDADRAYLLVHHTGGPLYLGQYDTAPDASFAVELGAPGRAAGGASAPTAGPGPAARAVAGAGGPGTRRGAHRPRLRHDRRRHAGRLPARLALDLRVAPYGAHPLPAGDGPRRDRGGRRAGRRLPVDPSAGARPCRRHSRTARLRHRTVAHGDNSCREQPTRRGTAALRLLGGAAGALRLRCVAVALHGPADRVPARETRPRHRRRPALARGQRAALRDRRARRGGDRLIYGTGAAWRREEQMTAQAGARRAETTASVCIESAAEVAEAAAMAIRSGEDSTAISSPPSSRPATVTSLKPRAAKKSRSERG